MPFFTPKPTFPYRVFQDVVQATSKFAWGPSTDPNKIAPPMAQYCPDEKWPIWCRVSSHGSHLVKVTFLDSLPLFMQGKHDSSILDQVDNIRLRRLSHYKCYTDWNHEFVRADLVDERNNKPLIMIWERDLPLTSPKFEKTRGLWLKSGLPCQSVDRVTYITEADFKDFVKLKDAYILRAADFPAPGPTILEVASVLETHSLRFPTYHVYSTMCYWYADSTFEVLVEIGKAQLRADVKAIQKKGVWSWGSVDCLAYNGVTRQALAETATAGTNATGAVQDYNYEQQLVQIQNDLVVKYDKVLKKPCSQKDLAQPRAMEGQATKQYDWDVAQFLSMIQGMPTHQKLRDESIARGREVRERLEKIQNGQEEREAAQRREAEAKKCAERERVMVEEEEKWRGALAESTARLNHAERRADLAEKVAEQERERAEQERERAEQERERAHKLATELGKLKQKFAH